MKRIVFVLLFLAVVFAQCEMGDYSSISTGFKITGYDADFITVAKLQMSEDCLAEHGLAVLLDNPAECTSDIYDDIYKGTGKIIDDTECIVTYDSGFIEIQGRGKINLFVKEVSGQKEISFEKWNVRESNITRATLEITLPDNVEDFQWAPRENSKILENRTIYWESIPLEGPSVIYTVIPEDNTNQIVFGLGIFLGFIGLFFAIRYVGNIFKKKKEIADEEQLTKQKKKQLEYEFLKRRIDESTFKKMLQGYNQKLAEIRARKKK